jgi:hypothetical protein
MASNAFADVVAKSRPRSIPSRVVASRNPIASSARTAWSRELRAPRMSRCLLSLTGRLHGPTQRLTSGVIGAERQLAFAEVPDMLGLLAWMFKDALIAAIDREIDAEADDAASLSHEERQQREAEAQGDLLDIERQEAELVWQAQAQGLPVEHRADISPLALLGLRMVTTPRVNEIFGTTPGFSWPMRR